MHTFCHYHNKSPFCSSPVLVSLHCVSCNLFLMLLLMCCSFWMSVADVQLLRFYLHSSILEALCSLVPLISWKPWIRGHWGCWGCCSMVLAHAFPLGRKSCVAEGSGMCLTTEIRWIPDAHYGSASPWRQVFFAGVQIHVQHQNALWRKGVWVGMPFAVNPLLT